MMSAQYIDSMSRKAARESAREGKLPYIVWPHDISAWKAMLAKGISPRLPFPALGSRNPRGFKLVQEFFVDSSGWGGRNEPAMTIDQLIDELKPNMAYSLGDVGQFQLYVREWKPGPKAMAEQDAKTILDGADSEDGPQQFADNQLEPVIVIMQKKA